MPSIVRPDVAAKAVQLTKATLTTNGTTYQPWSADANKAAQPVTGVLVQSDYANAPGSYIEVGGPGIMAGNGIQLAPGDTDLINAPNAAAIWAIPSADGLLLRGQVR